MFFGVSGSIAGGTTLTLPLHARGHVVAHVEQRLRVVLDVGQQLRDRLRVGRREVDVAAPHPALGLLGHEPVQRRRLRVVDQADVPAAGQLAGVHLVVAPPGRPLLLVEVLGSALERVVHQLGRVEELLAPVDHLPLAVQAHVAHQRHERVEDLRDAAAERGRRDVHDPLALQRLGQLADFGDQLPAADVRVVGERLVGRRRRAGARGGTIPDLARGPARIVRLDAGRGSLRPAGSRPRGLRSRPMLNGRLYRAAFVPFLFALAIAAFSLSARPPPLTSTLAPDAFEGARAFAELNEPGRGIPGPAPGQRRRRAAGARTSRETLEGLGGTAGGRLLGAHLHASRRRRSTANARSTTVIAQRPGSTSATPIVILAHRDAAGVRGSRRPSCPARPRCWSWRACSPRARPSARSCSSRPAAAAAATRARPSSWPIRRRRTARTVRRGDRAGRPGRRASRASRSWCLTRTASAPPRCSCSARSATRSPSSSGSTPARRARSGSSPTSAFPFAVGEQGALNAGGLPAVLVQVSGERGPAPRGDGQRGTPGRLRAGGAERRGCARHGARHLRDDADGPAAAPPDAAEWALRLLADHAAARRRSSPPSDAPRARAPAAHARRALGACGRSVARCRSSPARCSLRARAGSESSARRPPCRPRRARCRSTARPPTAVVAVVLDVRARLAAVWACSCGACARGCARTPRGPGWRCCVLRRRSRLRGVGRQPVHRAAAVPALHLWLLLAAPELRPPAAAALALVALGLLPLALLIALLLSPARAGPGEMVWRRCCCSPAATSGSAAAILWSVAFGCAAAAAMLAAIAPSAPFDSRRRRCDRGHDPRPAVLCRPGIAWVAPSRLCDDRWAMSERPAQPLSARAEASSRGRSALAQRARAAGARVVLILARRAGAGRRGRHAGVAGAVLGAVREAPPGPSERDLRAVERARAHAGRASGRSRACPTSARGSPSSRASCERRARDGSAVGRIVIPRIGASFVVVKGTDTAALKSGPGIYSETSFPGVAGTTAIAGHRTTYLAPFRHIDALAPGQPHPAEHALRALHLHRHRPARGRATRRARRGRRRRLQPAGAVGLHAAVQRRQTAARVRAPDAHSAGGGRAAAARQAA